MDHDIANLDDCIFDYLVSNCDEPKSFDEIYDSISKSSGHRCSELNKYDAKKKYGNYFLSTCYGMSDNYKNVHKTFKRNVGYLMYSDNKSFDNIDIKSNNIPTNTFNMFDGNKSNEIIKCYMDSTKNYNYETYVNEDETMTEFIIKQGNLDLIKQLVNKGVINLNTDRELLINLAIKHKKYSMINNIFNLVLEENNKRLGLSKYNNTKNSFVIDADEMSRIMTTVNHHDDDETILTCYSMLSNILCFACWIIMLMWGFKIFGL